MRPETSETTTKDTLDALMAKNPSFVSRKDHKKNPNQVELGYSITVQGQDRIKEFQSEIDAYVKANNPVEKKSFRETYWWLIGIGGIIVGFFTPGISGIVTKNILGQNSEQTILLKTDTVCVQKTDTLYLADSLLKK